MSLGYRKCPPAAQTVNPEFDVLILGAGLVGSSLACALDGTGLRVGVVEATLPTLAPPGFDERKLALAAASINALTRLGVIAEMSEPTSPIERIHVSRVGDFGSVRLDPSDSGRSNYGAVVPARVLGEALERRLRTLSNMQWLRPQTVTAIACSADGVRVGLSAGESRREVRTRLLVAADGTRSFARQALGIECDGHDYQQTLLVCSLGFDRAANGTAYERFSNEGPVALLPMGRNYGAICAVPGAQADAISALDDVAYARYFQDRFGWRAGRVLHAGRRVAYPVASMVARAVVAQRSVLVGNAAQTIHPIGAQGFNLGLRDALTLAELIGNNSDDPGSAGLLDAYVVARSEDRQQTLAFSDGLARVTSNASLPMHVLRSLGLLALGNLPSVTNPLASAAMGFRGAVPRLARALR